jgi:Ca2+-binding RTX toxin-like protein
MAILNAPANGGSVYGTAGNDIINGSAFNDTLYGLSGNDTLNGLDGDDTLVGDGSVSYATAFAAQGSIVTAYTGPATTNSVSLTSMGLAADQSIWRIRNSSTVDRVVVLQSASQGNGNNGGVVITLTIPAMTDTFVPSKNIGTHKLFLNGKQLDVKAAGSQLFDAGATVSSIEGHDILNGGNGNDVLRGNGGDDKLSGDGGNDNIDGGSGTDTIYGGDGDDTITGGEGNDAMFGGNGNDTFVVEWSISGDKYDGGDGIDTFRADIAGLDAYAQEIDLVTGTNNWQDTFVNIENLIGGSNNDKFWGTDGANELYGRSGNDLLDGRGGNDKLFGEAGDDNLQGGSGDDALDGGANNDVLAGGAGADVLVGGDGIDTADYAASLAGVTVNLATGKGLGGDAEGDKLSGIENLIGSNLADVLTGDVSVNNLRAGDGNDIVYGSGGGDTIDGGADIDAVDYSASTAGVTVSLVSGMGIGGFAEGDRLSNVENLVGSAFADILNGDKGNNVLTGGKGDDVLVGGLGGDKLVGGDGSDLADYSASASAIIVNLGLNQVSGGDADGDSFSSIEGVIATKFADVLTGDIFANQFYAGAGNDILFGSGGGDVLDGGDDRDLVDYGNSTAGVTVNLLTGKGLGGFAQGDVLKNIEDLNGSKFADLLTGDGADNVIGGGFGADYLYGGDGRDILDGGSENDNLFGDAGDDKLSGGLGNDRITGGAGADFINGNEGSDTADYRHSKAGVDVSILKGAGYGADAEGDTLQFIENLSGSAFADTLTGDDGVNRLSGMRGEDRLFGLGGNDYIATGGGYDYVDGGDGIDTVTYEDSWDHVVVNLTTGVNKYGEASRDVLVNVENIVGSKGNDTITGDSGANRLTGGAGSDVLNGMGGIDYLVGGAGDDALTGGTGADVFVFNFGFGNDTITDFWAGAGRTDRIWLQGLGTAPAYTVADTAAGVVFTVAGIDTLTLTGVHLPQLHADDFIFS